MSLIILFLLASILFYLVKWWISVKVFRKKSSWIPNVPGKPIIGNALDFGNSAEILNNLSKFTKDYDGFFCVDLFTRRLIFATDYKFLEFLLTTTKILNKAQEYRFLHNWLGRGLLTADGPKWRKHRKILTPAFHFSILEQFVETFEANGDIMVNLLSSKVDQESVDIYPFITSCTLDIICETAMGVSINAQKNLHSDYVFAVKEICRILIERSFEPLKMFDALYYFTKDYKKEKYYLNTLHSHTESVIKTRKRELSENKENENTKEDNSGVKRKMAFLDLLLQAKDADGQPFSDRDIREEVDTFMFEGHDTTASAISFTLYCLATNSDAQQQAMEEQQLIFETDMSRRATYRDLQEMKYLEKVIKESLRLYPSVPFYSREPSEDIEYKDGKILPKGIGIVVFAFGVNRDPKVFPDPEKFDPSRFDRMVNLPYAYLPFSAGPRNCIGQKYALLEMKSTVSKVLRNFKIAPANPTEKPILASETVLKSLNGIKLKLVKRT